MTHRTRNTATNGRRTTRVSVEAGETGHANDSENDDDNDGDDDDDQDCLQDHDDQDQDDDDDKGSLVPTAIVPSRHLSAA